jgi:hypothetical protein
MIVNDVSALDRLFWKRAQASILRSPKIRTGVTRAPELRLAARRRGSAEVQVAHVSPLPLALGALMCAARAPISGDLCIRNDPHACRGERPMFARSCHSSRLLKGRGNPPFLEGLPSKRLRPPLSPRPLPSRAIEAVLRGFRAKRLMDLVIAWSQQWTALGLKEPASI